MMLKKTKIVASISDLRCEVDFIRSLFEAGMNVVRMNTAHGTREGMDKLINNVRQVSNRIAILIDTKGPEVRTTKIQDADQIEYHIGDKVRIVGNPDLLTTREQIAVSYPKFVTDLNNGDDILIDDGEMELKVIEKTNDYLLCEVQNESTLGSRKSVNVPGALSATSTSSLIHSFVPSRTFSTSVRFLMNTVLTSRSSQRLRIRRVLTTSTKSLPLPTALWWLVATSE